MMPLQVYTFHKEVQGASTYLLVPTRLPFEAAGHGGVWGPFRAGGQERAAQPASLPAALGPPQAFQP